MSRYERAYGTDWTTLDTDAAIERAYALGVAASLGEYHPEELEAVRAEMDTAYAKSVVDLAFDEGKTEARAADHDDDAAVWSTLVEEGAVTVDPEDVPTGGRRGLPAAIDRIEAIEKPDPGDIEAVEKPEFLERD